MLPGDRATCPKCRKKFRIPREGVDSLQHCFIVQQLADNERERIRLQDSFCDEHKEEQQRMYCHDCKENVCLICFTEKHRNHNSALIPEVADSFRRRIHDDIQQIQSAISSVRERSELDTAEFRSEVEDVNKKVLATGDIIKHFVDSQVNDLLIQLQSVTSESDKQVEAYRLALVKMDEFCKYSQELLDKGRPSDITRAGCELHDRATELLDNDVTAVKYRPPHLTFTPADVTQVQRLSLIGKLTVATDQQSGTPFRLY